MSDNIKVVLKVRPLITREIEEGLSYQWRVKNNTLYQIDQAGKDSIQGFTFDKVYDENTKTSDVYNDIAKPIVEAATAGFNGTIFAYGQTSSGKTYTMSGTDESPGIIQMAVLNLFELIKNVPRRDFLVRISYLEIYNETVKDLLDVSKENIKIHEGLQGIKVDVTEKVTASPEEVFEFMRSGDVNRQTGATNMNENSSRSHSIFQIIIESREHVEGGEQAGCVSVSQLNLVDLAGSERAGQAGATGMRFKEGTHINKSLSALALVIKQLSEDPNKYANYRDSKLTRILQNSLGGNAKTSIICAVTPAAVEETISTLQFANRAKAIKNKPEVNLVTNSATMIQSLTKQLSRLKTQLETKKNIEQDNYNLQQRIAKLQKLILNGFGQSHNVDVANSRRKNDQLRRKTISTIRTIEEEPVHTVPQFRTPVLKYNPMLIPGVSELAPTPLPTVIEEPDRAITPSPTFDKKIFHNDEIIQIDSDDDDEVNKMNCSSPYHKCYNATKTPPCVLRQNAEIAEKDLKDIMELTKREKMYTPSLVELLEELENNKNVIFKLREEVDFLNEQSKKKDFEVEHLKAKVKKAEDEINSYCNLKSALETKCKDYNTKLTDCEVSYESLKQKTKLREAELLALLEEQTEKNKREDAVFIKKSDKEVSDFMDIAKDISMVDNDNETELSVPNQSEQCLQLLESDLKSQICLKDETIVKLEATLNAEKQRVNTLETSCQDLKNTMSDFENKLHYYEEENSLLKSTIDTLNSTVKTQKEMLESAKTNIDSYNSIIQELQIKLTTKDKMVGVSISDSVLESMIENESKFITNNENMKNIIQSLKVALHAKNEEICLLKTKMQKSENDHNMELKERLDSKLSEIKNKQEKIDKLNEEINANILIIRNITDEKNLLMLAEKNLTEKLGTLTKSNEDLEKIIKEKDLCIEQLRQEINELSLNLTTKIETEKELLQSNQQLLLEIDDMKNNLVQFEKIIKDKSDAINLLQQENQDTEQNLEKAKVAVNKLQNIVSLLYTDFQKVPENLDNLVTIMSTLTANLNILEMVVTNLIKQKNELCDSNQELTQLLNIRNNDIDEKLKEIGNLQTSVEVLSLEKKTLSQLSQDLKLEITSNGNQINTLKKQLEDMEVQQLALKSELSKEECMPVVQEQNNLITTEKLESLEKEIDMLNKLLKSKEDCFAQALLEKENETKSLSKNIEDNQRELSVKTVELETMTQRLTDIHTQMNQAQNDRDHLLVDILSKVTVITTEFNIENSLSCEFFDRQMNTYEEIILILEKISNHLTVLALESLSKDSEQVSVEEILNDAKKEIRELTKQNIELRYKLSKTEHKSITFSKELEKIRLENIALNKNLVSFQELQQLKCELSQKATELDNMQVKAKEWKDEFINFGSVMKHQMKGLHLDNEKLNSLCQQESLQVYLKNSDELELNNTEYRYSKKEAGLLSPPSLLTICCEKIVDSMESKNKNSSSETPTLSSSDIELDRKHNCQCEIFRNLDLAQNQCTELHNVRKLESEKAQLLEEREDVNKELKLLVDTVHELQKKIANHKTNLSILTATTFAENTLLKSQVKGFQHHHDRFHNVCQRDIPAFKKQLQELLVILRKGDFYSSNADFKRFSLPDVLESNSTRTNFRNESILDGDLLMLDTNITLTTTSDNSTLVGYDQTCLDLTQTYNEVSCQTNEITQIADIGLEILKSDNLALLNQLELLTEENNHLREQGKKFTKDEKLAIDDSQNSSDQNNCSINNKQNDSFNSNICPNCKNFTGLFINHEKLAQETERITLELNIAKEQKDVIEKKYNKLSLEVISSDTLATKLNILEKDCQDKSDQIAKLKSLINSKNVHLGQLQEENNDLSMQLMENVSEVDDLNKKLESYEQKYLQLTQRCCSLEGEIKLAKENNIDNEKNNCPHCLLKNDALYSRQPKSISESHAKLNRRYSDSDTSSRFNKICTLQSELHAGRKDCIELTEDVTTIKNHLDRGNISMDLDITIEDPSVFTDSKDVTDVPQSDAHIMPGIPEEHQLDIYLAEKMDCLNYYVQKSGIDVGNINSNMKIIEIMDIFYNTLVMKHNSEVENLLNKFKKIDESKKQMHDDMKKLTDECSRLKSEFKENRQNNDVSLSQVKNNLNMLQTELSNCNDPNICPKTIAYFKNNVLNILDSKFEISTLNSFETLLNILVKKHEEELNEIVGQYAKSQKDMEKVGTEIIKANENLTVIKKQLADKEEENSLLKRQKDKMHEISNAVTMDILQKEHELNSFILRECQRLRLDIIDIEKLNLNKPVEKNLSSLFEILTNQINKNSEFKEQEESIVMELNKNKDVLKLKEKELKDLKIQNEQLQKDINTINLDLADKNNKLTALTDLHEKLNKVYESKSNENIVNINLIEKLTEEIEALKAVIIKKEDDIIALDNKQEEIAELVDNVSKLKVVNKNLMSINEKIVNERDSYKIELEKCLEIIQQNKIEFNKLNSDIIILRESVKDYSKEVDTLKNDAKHLSDQNMELKNKFDEKFMECSRLETNIKTLEKTVEIQSKIITRHQKQKEEDHKAMTDKDKLNEELKNKYIEIQTECESVRNVVQILEAELEQNKKEKESLEVRIADLQMENECRQKSRLSLDAIADISRQRRQSLYDSKRLFDEDKREPEDRNNFEAALSKSRPDEMFMDTDGEDSNRSTPLRLSRGRDSIVSRTDQSEKEDEHPSRPNSVVATRRRRQSTHDFHRSVRSIDIGIRNSPSPFDDSPNKVLKNNGRAKSVDKSIHNISDGSQLKDRLAICQLELEELKERYRELDEECEICAEYLRERDEQCLRLKKEKKSLEQELGELKTKLNSTCAGSQVDIKRNTTDTSVNTDEDWTKLHSLVVDRMSYDAEVDKNKKLTRTIEELRFQKQDLRNTIANMQKALDKQSIRDMHRELEAQKQEVKACKEELEMLRLKYKELDEECDTCAEYLRERDEQCRKLREAKALLEAKLQDYQDDETKLTLSVRKKRRNLHDQNRNSHVEVADVSTETMEDFLSYQVERDNSHRQITNEGQAEELKRLKITVEELLQQKASLEQQLVSVKTTPAQTMYVATGSAIVQNQQITDVMKENQKLKKINAKLMNICKKRGKSEISRENAEPEQDR